MRLLLDEMLPATIAHELRARGHDVESIQGSPRWESMADPDVMERARCERRAVITDNLRDYRRLHHSAVTSGGPGHFGMVFMPGGYARTRGDIGRIVAALETRLAHFPGDDDLADGETWL